MRYLRLARPLVVSGIMLLSLVLAACSGSGASAIGGDTTRDVDTADGYTGGPIPGASAAPAAVGGGEEVPGDGVGAPIDDARIVRTGTIELQVKDVPTALQTARDGVRALGGYIGASQTHNDGDSPVATVTYRIPVDRWEDALDLLRGLNGQTTKVVAEQTDAVEVTGAVVDLEARIKNLRASELALQEIAARAVRVTDVLEVQNQLTQVRGEIESLSAQLKDLEDRADYATLTASFGVPIVAVEVATQDWDPTTIVDEATASLVDVTQAVVSAGIWFVIVWLPILVVLGVLAMAATWVARRLGLIGRRRGPGGGTPAGWPPSSGPTGAGRPTETAAPPPPPAPSEAPTA